MTLHKLLTDRETHAHDAPSLNVTLKQDMYYLAAALVRARAVQACDFDLRKLPVHRTQRWSVRRKLERFIDEIALDGAFNAFRIHEGLVLITAPGLYGCAYGYRKADYSSCEFTVWAESVARAEEAMTRF